MTAPARSVPLCCPMCAAELTIEQLFAHAEDRQAFARLAAVSLPLGSKVLAYVNLFAPAKNRMTIPRKVTLIEQLLPDLLRGAIERKGRDWQVSHDDWREAIDRMLAARDARKLSLPLTSHSYLYETLAGMADKAEAQQERQVEQERQTRRATPQATGAQVADLVSTAVKPIASERRPVPPPPGTSLLARQIKAEIEARKAKLSPTPSQESPNA